MQKLKQYQAKEDPWRNQTEALTTVQKLKFLIMAPVVMPLRLVAAVVVLLAAALLTSVAMLGLKVSKDEPKPMTGWRRSIVNFFMPILCRSLLFVLGFLHIKVNGTLAPRGVAPIVVSNHAAPWEGMALIAISGATFVSAVENARLPVIGTIMRGLQTIVVVRGSTGSRDNVLFEIDRRAKDNRFPRIGIFPEGTTTNGTSLIKFRPGAFQPGVPVQPVIVKYAFQHMDPTWSSTSLGLGGLSLRMVTQWYNSMEITFLPVYKPNDDEKRDAVLYSNNVREYMGKMGRLKLSDYTLEDYFIITEARKYGIDQKDAVVGMENVRKTLNLTVADIKSIMKSFHEIDVDNTGVVSYNDFIHAMGLPDIPAARSAFKVLACGEEVEFIDFRHFLEAIMHISRDINTDEKIKLAFEICNISASGKITEQELAAVMDIATPNMQGAQIKTLFKRMDVRRVGFIDLFEFGSFMRLNPTYMQVFEALREQERSKGSNPVLDMFALRAQGVTVTVEKFLELVKTHRDKKT